MKNYVQPGDSLKLAAPYNRSAGQGALVGSIFGVAAVDVLSGAEAVFDTVGVFDIAKVSAQAWASVGLPIYWDDTDKVATTAAGTSGANKLIGVNIATAANPSSTGRVRLNGVFGLADVGDL